MTSKTKIFKDKKAQVDAPFEVLVAVILMGFVILAGTYALKNLSQNICIGEKRQDLSEFKNALRDVVLGSDLTFKNIYIKSKSCFNREHEITKIVTYSDPHRCSAYCQTSSQICTLIEYVYDDGKTSVHPITPICTDLPSAVNFEDDPANCNININTEELMPTGGKNNEYYVIEPGYYRMYKVSAGTSSTETKICVVRKKSGS